MRLSQLDRRTFLAASALGGSSLLAIPGSLAAAPPPTVTNPRATDGDEKFEPQWDQRLTLTVGNKKADLVGADDKVIQAAVDYVTRLGGGTVKILPGTYTLRNAVWLSSRIRILGSGADSIITKIDSKTVALAADSDWYDQEVTVKGGHGFRVGDGVVMRTKNPSSGATDVIKRTLVARSGNRFKLNDGLRKNVWLSGKPTISSLFPLFTSENTADVLIENLTLDGNRQNNGHLDGNYAGCIFLQDCNRYTIRNVTTRNYNGDGISFQICHDVLVENCHSHDNADLGVHPGSGSQRPVIRGSKMVANTIGLFWCWGVKFGLAEDNYMDGNRNYGISIGHCDTNNVMRNNEIHNSGKVGILFRDDTRGQDFWANHNVLEKNKVVDSGGEAGVAIDIHGQTRDTRITGNEIIETRQPMKRTGIRIAKTAGEVQLDANTIRGFATDVDDQRS
jgi:hypothetical protein